MFAVMRYHLDRFGLLLAGIFKGLVRADSREAGKETRRPVPGTLGGALSSSVLLHTYLATRHYFIYPHFLAAGIVYNTIWSWGMVRVR